MSSSLTALNTLPFAWLLSLIAIIGLCLGSFLNVVIYRLAIKLKCIDRPCVNHLLWSRSFCPRCQQGIAWYDNIPVFSFCLLKGRCRLCRQQISKQYLCIELLTLCLTAAIFLRFGLHLHSIAIMVIVWWLIPLSLLDFNYFILPNVLTLSLLGLGLGFNYFALFVPLSTALIGACLGYLSLGLIDTIYFLLRKQHGIGQGDWKLFAALGACLGWQSLLPLLLIASLLATLVGLGLILLKRATLQSALPFGVFLSIAGLIVLLIGQPFIQMLWP